ncbi:CPBP family intramembrane metalloprotease [Bacillaceae bacterium Marseille-Q3522]|nr:CPBP family intramembrane metalloprotease [Bacillaceae bacterium Marseille-Q3522]
MRKKSQYEKLISSLTDRELLVHLYGTQIFLLTISVFLGMIVIESYSAFFDILKWHPLQIFVVGGGSGLVVVIIDMILMKYLPAAFYDDGGVNERIFRYRKTVHIAWIAAMIAISEELLFRGIIQTHFGLFISSAIFALLHFRYLRNWFLFVNVVLLSFFIGFIYLLTENLFVTIFMHFIIDFLLGLHIKMTKNTSSKS